MAKADATIYEVNVGDEVHSIFETPSNITNLTNDKNASSTFNLVMVDVSGSMEGYWEPFIEHWNKYISPLLPDAETTKIFVFGSSVYFVRNGNFFESEDFRSEGTNLTDAIGTINEEIHSAKESYIRLFLVTDGDHNETKITPDVEIAKLSIPPEKTIEVFLFAFGMDFPVEYSITIRSALHNGNANVPSIFWAQIESYVDNSADILDQIQSIAEIVEQGNAKFKIQPVGKLAPGFLDVDIAHFGEFIYYTKSPDSLLLSLQTEEGESIDLNISVKTVELRFLLDRVFRQWNSIIIQHHRKKLEVPFMAFEVMDSIYAFLHKKLLEELENVPDCSIKMRLAKKNIKFLETEFATLMNQSKTIIGLEGKYSTEMELAENILKTTVKSKHDIKNLKIKGHGIEDYDNDLGEFIKVFESIKESIFALPEPSPDDCCRVTMTSMVKDLQDPSLTDLFKEDKFTFMKTFTVTGIPVFASVKSFSQINPWTLCIVNILKSPFTIVSQSTLELSAEVAGDLSDDKEIYLQEGEEDSKFNVIVPVLEPGVALVLKSLIRTNIFAMLSTFCILKNPHIIDHNAHIAALGCTWIKLITDNAGNKKPEYVTQTLSLIEATADLYTDRGGIAKYIDVLLSEPQEALMTESSKLYGEKTLKCESLIKPMFLLYLVREKQAVSEILPKVIPLIILDFIGRCLSNFQNEINANCIYSLLFVPELNTVEKRESFFKNKCEETCNQILESFEKSNGSLIKAFFKPEDLQKSLKEFCRKHFKTIKGTELDVKVNSNLIEHWKNAASAGNIRLASIKAFASEFQLSEEIIQSFIDEKLMFVYVYHCLRNKSSKDRLTNPLPTYEKAFENVKIKIAKENKISFEITAKERLLEETDSKWREDYALVHSSEVVEPMKKSEILQLAIEKGVDVSEENFDKVYRYNTVSGLLRNTCMVKSCPFYLIPNRTFNQHISIERTKEYVHQLHKISRETASKDLNGDDVIKTIKEGYQSQNGLTIPKTPSEDYLQSLSSKINVLVDQYKNKILN